MVAKNHAVVGNLNMKNVIISAPFGNYLHFANATRTLGTFTLHPRGGLLWRIWRVAWTVRYYPSLGAWRNRLGLPNPGIDSLWGHGRAPDPRPDVSDALISVKGMDNHSWCILARKVHGLQPLGLEMNASCPNCPGEDVTDYARAFAQVRQICNQDGGVNAGIRMGHEPPETQPMQPMPMRPIEVIVKLPPVYYDDLVRRALDAGITVFHCCNTLPVPGGGMSGKPLQPLALRCIEDVRRMADRAGIGVRVIGGGGVTGVEDAARFYAAGATNIAIGSALFLPWRWGCVGAIAGMAQGAHGSPPKR